MSAALLLLLTTGVAAQETPGSRATFLGWDPDSTEFAYKLARTSSRDAWFLKRPHPNGPARFVKADVSVKDRIRRRGFVTTEVKGQRLDKRTQAFVVAPGRTLRVVLEIGKRRLWYTIWLDDAERPTEPRRITRGYFDEELWTSLDSRVFPSPDRRWAAIVLTTSTPWRTRAAVEGVQIDFSIR